MRKSQGNTTFIGTLYEVIDVATKKALCDLPRKIACKASCSFCCHQPIAATFLEWAEVWRYMLTLPLKKREAIKQRFEAIKEEWLNWCGQTGGSDHQIEELEVLDYWGGKPCVFLNPGTNECDIYPARVYVCRTTFSFETCASFRAFRLEPQVIQWVKELMIDFQAKGDQTTMYLLLSFLSSFKDEDW